ncbi:MAG TPA: ATPase [Anaerolineae bacterium]|mgnify:CR=1 FL=1|nr:ATPase [Anaerolineae bacterium]HMR63871.1 ATPase [Anaerolineae bacterium]
MDILHLIDRLEALVSESFHLPFTTNVIVQEDALLDIIDQMRVSIPEEVKLAKRTEAERERMLLQAQEEANRLVEMAREKARQMTEEHELVNYAQQRAQTIEENAYRQADEILAETDDYIIDQLSELEEQLMKTLTTVRNGLRLVQETRRESAPTAQEHASSGVGE